MGTVGSIVLIAPISMKTGRLAHSCYWLIQTLLQSNVPLLHKCSIYTHQLFDMAYTKDLKCINESAIKKNHVCINFQLLSVFTTS